MIDGTWLLALALAAQNAVAPQPSAPVVVPIEPAPLSVATDRASSAVPEGTPLDFEILDRVHSKLNKAGDTFRIRLSQPIMAGNAVVVPAGAEGAGEVIHAARARAAGKAGELILTARYIEHDGRRIPLRAFRFGKSGNSHAGTALAVGIAAGPLAYFIVGGEVDVAPGTAGYAKLAASLDTRASAAAPASLSTTNPQ